jgi:uncharacterized repeat protein (TIGR01451 family)
MKRHFLYAAALGAVAAPAFAAPLTITSDVRVEKKIAAADGTTRVALVKADKAVPGDSVTFVLSYHNTGTQPIANLVLANPIPKGVAYRAPASGSTAPEVSTDGIHFGALGTLRVASAAGATKAAGLDDITAVRWRLANPVPAGGKGELAFRAVLK